jgi:hypothetical protein
VAGELARLHVQGEGLVQLCTGEMADWRARQELPDQGHGVADLDGKLGRRGRVPGWPQCPDDGQWPGRQLSEADARPPGQYRPVAIGPGHVGSADLPAKAWAFHPKGHASCGLNGVGHGLRVEALGSRPPGDRRHSRSGRS